MNYNVKIETFEGPLDLLLSLVSKEKLKIEEVSLSDLTAQYLSYIKRIEEMDMEVASDFIVVASTLLYIKSSKLLPSKKSEVDISVEIEENLLKKQLVEYSKIKEAAIKLHDQAFDNLTSYYRDNEAIAEQYKKSNDTMLFQKEKLSQTLIRIAKKLDKQPDIPLVHTISRESVTIKSKMIELKSYFNKFKNAVFRDLLLNKPTRRDVILTFLAMLNLNNGGMLEVLQEQPFGDIFIQRKETKWTKSK